MNLGNRLFLYRTFYEWGPDFVRPSQYYCMSWGDSSWSLEALTSFYLFAECASGYYMEDFWQANYGGYLFASFECRMDDVEIDYDEVCGSFIFGMTSHGSTEASDGRRIYLCEPQ